MSTLRAILLPITILGSVLFAFGETANGFVRLGFVVDEASLIDACERIAAFVGGLPVRTNV